MEPLKNIDVDDLDLDQIELVEKISLRLAFQAIVWFAPQAWDIFDRSPDNPQDIAEDSTREAIGVFKGFSINERLFGTLDFKQARWLPMPFGLVPQAMMVDSKAKLPYSSPRNPRGTVEEGRLDLQMSQVSMVPHLGARRDGQPRPHLEPKLNKWMELRFDGDHISKAITSVVTVHYSYDVKMPGQVGNRLRKIIMSAVPNGLLQDRYSPSSQRTIFAPGKHSPGRGEDPRVRIYYGKLLSFAHWRVQEILFGPDGQDTFHWKDIDEQGRPITIPVSVEARLKMPVAGPAERQQRPSGPVVPSEPVRPLLPFDDGEEEDEDEEG